MAMAVSEMLSYSRTLVIDHVLHQPVGKHGNITGEKRCNAYRKKFQKSMLQVKN